MDCTVPSSPSIAQSALWTRRDATSSIPRSSDFKYFGLPRTSLSVSVHVVNVGTRRCSVNPRINAVRLRVYPLTEYRVDHATRHDLTLAAQHTRGDHMPRAINKVCTVPGCPRIQPETRCAEHRRTEDQYRKATTPTKNTRTHSERMRRKHAVDTHRALHGEHCPGHGRPPHTLTPTDGGLTADHITPASHGGANGPLQILCRSCNGRKGDRI